MTLYLIPKPVDKLGRKGRETGWRRVPHDREAIKQAQEYGEQLKDKGIALLVCSDLDTKMAEVLRDKLNCNVRPDFDLRRFNVGHRHAADHIHIERILMELLEKWKQNPDIPMPGGDSLTSFEKRFVARFRKLLAEKGEIAFLVDERTLSVVRDLSLGKYSAASLVPNGTAPKMDRIYVIQVTDASRPTA